MRVYIKTFGCELNRADSEAIAEQLKKSSISLSSSERDSDAVIVNTCTVRRDTELKVLKYISSLKGKRVLVTGCMAAAQPGLVRLRFPDASIVSLNNLPEIPDALRGRVISVKSSGSRPSPAPFTSGLVFTIPISRGCLGHCSYCIVRLARGALSSLPPKEIISAMSRAGASGALEIRLAAQDTGTYGKDLGISLADLLGEVAALPYDFRVRIGMFNPSSVYGYLQDLAASYRSRNIYKFAHVPLQSGSDRILELMRRDYDLKKYFQVIGALRGACPGITIATDIMVGYPGETDEDFRETIEALHALDPDKIHISRFTPRPHTPAALMKQVPEHVKKQRSRIAISEKLSIQEERNKKWVNREVEATVLHYKAGIGALARTDEYKPVLIKGGGAQMLGSRALVEICSCTPFCLIGQVIRR